MRTDHPLDNLPLEILCDVVRESLTMPVRGVRGGPYAKHDRGCLAEYEAILLACEAEQ